MPDTPYTKRELDVHFDEVKETLKRIEKQTTTTNGRVSKLESWKSKVTGGIAIIVMLVIPLVVYAFALALDSH